MDFIESRFRDKGVKPNVIVHEHCGESGAIGAAIEANRLWKMGRQTSFIGLDAVQKISYVTHRSEDTRCYFCKNKCLRTFIDVKLMPGVPVENLGSKTSKIPIAEGTKRLIVNNSCDSGLVEDVNAMREIKKGMDSVKDANPNMAEIAAKTAFKSFKPAAVADPLPRYALTARQKARVAAMKRRAEMRIGIPRVLNQYTCNPHVQRLLRVAGHSGGEPGLLRLHLRGAVQGRRQARLDRSLLPVEGRHPARAQPALRAPQEEAARHHLLPDDRRSAVRHGQRAEPSRLPHGHGDARGHQRRPSSRKAISSRRWASSS